MPSLRIVLRLNAASCLGFGALFLVASHPVAAFLGTIPVMALQIIGVILVANGVHLVLASLRKTIRRWEVIWFSVGDLAWWSGSLGLLAAEAWIVTDAGTLAAWLVAVGVAFLGLAQLWFLGKGSSGLKSKEYWARMGKSWMALPAWVKVWLFVLNAAFLGALAFYPSGLTRVVLIAYVSSGPLVLGFMFAEGGLSRLSGLGHIVPWTPLFAWLLLWLDRQPGPSGEAAYAVTLAAVIGLCLAFDIYDVKRWGDGERALMGEGSST